MLNELEEVLELVEAEQIAQFGTQLFHVLAKCVCCPHFQVAERALFLWNNEHLINVRVVHALFVSAISHCVFIVSVVHVLFTRETSLRTVHAATSLSG